MLNKTPREISIPQKIQIITKVCSHIFFIILVYCLVQKFLNEFSTGGVLGSQFGKYALILDVVLGTGYFFIGFIPIFVIGAIAKRRNLLASLFSIYRASVVSGVILLTFVTFGTWYANRSLHFADTLMPKYQNTTSDVSPYAAPAEVAVMVTRQPNQGAKSANLSPENVDRIGKWWRDTLVKKMPVQPINIEAIAVETSVVEIGSKRLGVSKIRLADEPFAVLIFGLEGNEFIRVQCMTRSKKEISIFSGPCGDKIKAVLGVSIN